MGSKEILEQLKGFTGLETDPHNAIINLIINHPEIWDMPEFHAFFPELLQRVNDNTEITYAMEIPEAILSSLSSKEIESEPLKDLCIALMLDLLPTQRENDVDVHVLGTICTLLETMEETHTSYPRLLAETLKFLNMIKMGEGLNETLQTARQQMPFASPSVFTATGHYFLNEYIFPICKAYQLRRMYDLCDEWVVKNPLPVIPGAQFG